MCRGTRRGSQSTPGGRRVRASRRPSRATRGRPGRAASGSIRARVSGKIVFLLDERAPEHEVAKLLQRVSDAVGDRVYIVGLCAGRFVDKIGFSMLCPAGMSCHACCRACVKWHGFPLDVNNAQRVIAYLPAGAREVALE